MNNNNYPIQYLGYLLLFFVVLTACENDLADVERLSPKESVNVEVAKEVELIYSDSAVIRVVVSSPEMLTHNLKGKQMKQEFPDGIAVDFYNERSRVQSELTARYAVRHEDKKEIEIRDSVVWKSLKPEILETEELIWDEKKERVYSKRFVKITTPTDIIYGYGFEANEDFTKWKITAVTGQMGIEDFNKQFE